MSEAMTFEEYLRHPALSASGAKQILRAPALYRHSCDTPSESTSYFDFGKAAHKVVLGEGDPIEVLDYDDWRSKGACDAKAEANAAGRIPLLMKDWVVVEAMAQAVRNNPFAKSLLAAGEAEKSYFWTDPATGCPCKARLDWVTRSTGGMRIVVDYKTAASADPDEFRRAIRRYGYPIQVANNIDAIRRVEGEEADFLFIAQEKTEPYLTSVVGLTDLDIQDAEVDLQEARETYVECTRTGIWPGYDRGIYRVVLPPSYRDDTAAEMVI